MGHAHRRSAPPPAPAPAAPARSAERDALAAAIDEHAAARATLAEAERRYEARYGIASAARDGRDAAADALKRATDAAADRLAGGPVPTVSMAEARARFQAAEDDLAAAEGAPARFAADLTAARQRVAFAVRDVDGAAVAVLRAEAHPAALALLARVERQQLELHETLRALEFLSSLGALDRGELPAAAWNRFAMPAIHWRDNFTPPGAVGDAPWRAALAALKDDAGAPIPSP